MIQCEDECVGLRKQLNNIQEELTLVLQNDIVNKVIFKFSNEKKVGYN